MDIEIKSADPEFINLVNSMKEFAEAYAKATETYFCKDQDITKSVVVGLAKNKFETSAALCPCRCYSDCDEESSFNYWSCPCLPMRERKECHCMLFLTKDNSAASENQEINISLN